MSWADLIKPCPFALDGAIYRDCPRLVHGLDGEPCADCVSPAQPYIPPGIRRELDAIEDEAGGVTWA